MTARALAVALLSLCAAACSSYAGTARAISPASIEREPGWIAVRGMSLVRQQADSDCGPAAIAMVVAHWTGAPAPLETLRPAPERGTPAGRLRDYARERGLAAFLIEGQIADLERELSRGRPVVVGLVKPQRKGVLTHYEVVVALHPKRGIVVTLDPAQGWRQNTVKGFFAEWEPAGRLALVVSARTPPGRRTADRCRAHRRCAEAGCTWRRDRSATPSRS